LTAAAARRGVLPACLAGLILAGLSLAGLSLAGLILAGAALPASSAPAKPGAAPDRSCERARFSVALDVGHTAQEPGAISTRSVSEYDFNLALAERIGRELRAAGFARTLVLVTAGPALPGLVRRVAAANAARADLLVSIHHDSVPDSLLQHMGADGGPRRFSDRFSGHSIFVSHENADRAGSLQFAKLLGARLKDAGLRFTPHYTEKFMGGRRRVLLDRDVGVYRFDRLYVLRAARMPAVLFEAGLIINPAEENILAGEERQGVIARAMREAVEAFCAALPAQPAASVRKRK
jgi:N-acetylmuramoyl-L-alanine amidase